MKFHFTQALRSLSILFRHWRLYRIRVRRNTLQGEHQTFVCKCGFILVKHVSVTHKKINLLVALRFASLLVSLMGVALSILCISSIVFNEPPPHLSTSGS